MNPNLRKILIAIGLVTLLLIGIFVVPRGLSLYFQTRGGQQIEYVLRFEEGINELLCEQVSPSNETTREEVNSAIEDLNRAILLNKNNSQAHFYLGKANCLLGNPAEAVENFEQYTQIRPNNLLGYIGLGFAYEQLGDISAAGDAWKSAELTVDDFNQAGDEEFRADNYNDAIIWYERALLTDSNSADTWLNIGKVYDAMQDYETALEAYIQAWENEPEISIAALVESYKRNGDINSVKDILEIMLEKYPDSNDRLLWFQELGSLYLSQGDYDQAIELYTQAINEFVVNPDLHVSLGWALYERGDGVESTKLEFEKAIDLDRDNVVGYYAIGLLMNREENFIEAQKWFGQASELEPDNRWYQLIFGNAVRNAGRLEKSIEIYNNIIEKHPSYDRAHLELAQVLFNLNQIEEAKISIEKAIQFASSPTEWYFIRAGRIFENAGDIEIALKYYYQALGINPTNSTALQAVELLEE